MLLTIVDLARISRGDRSLIIAGSFVSMLPRNKDAKRTLSGVELNLTCYKS